MLAIRFGKLGVCRYSRLFIAVMYSVFGARATALEPPGTPNVVFILCDNLGNGDIGCFNPNSKHRTPHLDRMAAEGKRLTSFYSASGVCTPSRAALMTGCYPLRVGLHVSYEGHAVLKPVDKKGLHPAETTLAEVFKSMGYATACFGKWHLGDQPAFLPLQNGFDRFDGIPYSEDMMAGVDPHRPWPPLPLMNGNRVEEAPVEASGLTKRFTEAATAFIREHRDRPFFLYFPATGPGSRREAYPGEAFRGQSANGLYGDSIEELDWSAGEVLRAIRDHGLDERTLVVWTNDNGAVRRMPQQGSNAPYQGFGYSTSEGGMRMPCIVRWPGKIAAGTECRELCSMMDWLPTLAKIIGAAGPSLPIDGHDIGPLLFSGGDVRSPYDDQGFWFYHFDQIQAVRAGPWKLYLPLKRKWTVAKNSPPVAQPAALYNVVEDVGETVELSREHPAIVAKLTAMAERARRSVGDLEIKGNQAREAGWEDSPRPLLMEAAK